MKFFKNLSLVYVLQISAVLILFFYPEQISKAQLKDFAISNIGFAGVGETSFPGTDKVLVPNNNSKFLLTGSNMQTMLNNQFKNTTEEDYKYLGKKYCIDAISLQNLHLKLSKKTF